MRIEIDLLPGEGFWGGSVNDGCAMPFTATSVFRADHRRGCENQGMPLLLSDKGRYIWSETPLAFSFETGKLTVESDTSIEMAQVGETLRDAYLGAMRTHFPFSGKVPRKEFFETAQYNTWMQFTYDPTEERVLSYAHAIVDHGYTPGILIIDEGWHLPYGDWRFDPVKFPHPKEMIRELHALGFKVMLWVVPYVRMDGRAYLGEVRRDLNPGHADEIFLRTAKGDVAVCRWWNGYSALLDMTNAYNRAFLDRQLRALTDEYGVDGFKFDGGTMRSYTGEETVNGKVAPVSDAVSSAMARNLAWNEFGARYEFHEYKDTYKGGGKPVIQRLRDRGHCWDNDGINTILPNSLVQGLLGYPFICPDMIGGGEWSYRVNPALKVDEELFVRMAALSAFFPMMQFSWAPWEALSEENQKTVLGFARLHARMAPALWEIISESAKTGEPILRSLEYQFPHSGYRNVTDEFLVGDKFLVCPVVTKGTTEKEVLLPEGNWQDETGRIYVAGTYRLPAPLDTLLWFRKV